MTKLGAGLTWGAVYGVLEKKNLTVVGGRLTSVGVAGLTLGGGISHFSGLYGFACDNVRNFEVRTSFANMHELPGALLITLLSSGRACEWKYCRRLL